MVFCLVTIFFPLITKAFPLILWSPRSSLRSPRSYLPSCPYFPAPIYNSHPLLPLPLFEVEGGTYKRSTNSRCTRAGKYRYRCLIKFSFIWHGLISLKSTSSSFSHWFLCQFEKFGRLSCWFYFCKKNRCKQNKKGFEILPTSSIKPIGHQQVLIFSFKGLLNVVFVHQIISRMIFWLRQIILLALK